MPSRTKQLSCIIVIGCIAALGWVGYLELSEVQLVFARKERRNRLVLVRNLLDEYFELRKQYPTDVGADDGHILSWRIHMLNDLHSSSPHSIAKYPGFEAVTFPLTRTSLRPHCYGKEQLTIFGVSDSSIHPHWESLVNEDRVAVDYNPIIVVEMRIRNTAKLQWSEPNWITYANGGTSITGHDGTKQEIESISDVFLLHLKGNIQWIKGPVSGEEFASVLSKTDWSNKL